MHQRLSVAAITAGAVALALATGSVVRAEDIGSGLELFVPIGRTTGPAIGRDGEGTGVLPDVAVPADRALEEALRRVHAAG